MRLLDQQSFNKWIAIQHKHWQRLWSDVFLMKCVANDISTVQPLNIVRSFKIDATCVFNTSYSRCLLFILPLKILLLNLIEEFIHKCSLKIEARSICKLIGQCLSWSQKNLYPIMESNSIIYHETHVFID